MELNADFSQPIAIRPADYRWVASPAAGVDRMMLDRIGAEVARATTIVRFAPNSQFDAHTHGGGEEFLVLDGVFSDEHRDYPAGTYVRNPIGTAHRPHIGPEGATILVKLCQFDATDTAQFHIDTTTAGFATGTVPGITVLDLHRVPSETVTMIRFDPAAKLPAPDAAGDEVFVLDGTLNTDTGAYPARSWLRSPAGMALSSDTGCLIYRKTGHLPQT